jgi:hypothetical protein
MKAFPRVAGFSILGVLFLASALFAQSLTIRVPRGNVRARAEKTSPVIGNMRKGELYPIEARQGDWFRILLETGREGWVFKSLVEVSATRTIGVVPWGPARTAHPLTATPGRSSWGSTVTASAPSSSTTPSTTPKTSRCPSENRLSQKEHHHPPGRGGHRAGHPDGVQHSDHKDTGGGPGIHLLRDARRDARPSGGRGDGVPASGRGGPGQHRRHGHADERDQGHGAFVQGEARLLAPWTPASRGCWPRGAFPWPRRAWWTRLT